VIFFMNNQGAAADGWGLSARHDGVAILLGLTAWGTVDSDPRDGDWHSYMVTRNGNTYNYYRDGGGAVLSTLTHAGGTFGGFLNFGGNNSGTNSWDGELDEVVIFNSIKSTADFAEFHNSGNGIAYPFKFPRHGFVNFQDPGVV